MEASTKGSFDLAKTMSAFICQACGAIHPRWTGRCDSCDEWNTVIEEGRGNNVPLRRSSRRIRRIEVSSLDEENYPLPRRTTNLDEFDRVTGGGLVCGSVTLIGGNPGIGKSTLLLQIAAGLAPKVRCVYITGEEAVGQVQMRARRLRVEKASVSVAAATNMAEVIAMLNNLDFPELIIIDSIQTMYLDTLDSAPGTVAQVRASAQELIRLAKERGSILLIVGHVTKEGVIAGPRVLEHMVDTVLYFEGEQGHQYRILRAVKNRFGATDEIGVFEMTEHGLDEVENPSELFLAEHSGEVAGSAVFAGIEGTRPLLVEIQALVASSSLATPRRAVVGWDSSRLAMVLAVLEAHCGLRFSGAEVYLNVAGGLRIGEPAADLAVAAALTSSMTGIALPIGMVVFGEISLSGEVRSVRQTGVRLKEAAKLGFRLGLVPSAFQINRGDKSLIKVCSVSRLSEMLRLLKQDGADRPRPLVG